MSSPAVIPRPSGFAKQGRQGRFDYIIVQVFKATPAVALLLSKLDDRLLPQSVGAGVAYGANRSSCV